MVVGLLDCTQEQGVFRLYEKRSSQHYGHIHISKLHK